MAKFSQIGQVAEVVPVGNAFQENILSFGKAFPKLFTIQNLKLKLNDPKKKPLTCLVLKSYLELIDQSEL